jgi:RNA polymerase sigma-70 factor (ECF subfamily)
MKRMALPKHARQPHPGNANAATEFEQLLREHVPALYRSAFRWTGTVDRAEDLVQELLVRLYPKLPELRGLERVRPWVLRVMYRMFVDQVRRERHSPLRFRGESQPDSDLSDEQGDESIDASAGTEELAEQEFTQDRVVAAWEQLGEEHRVVLSMHDIEDYSLPELSQIMEVPIGTLKSRLHRARAKLRGLLAMERFQLRDRV